MPETESIYRNLRASCRSSALLVPLVPIVPSLCVLPAPSCAAYKTTRWAGARKSKVCIHPSRRSLNQPSTIDRNISKHHRKRLSRRTSHAAKPHPTPDLRPKLENHSVQSASLETTPDLLDQEKQALPAKALVADLIIAKSFKLPVVFVAALARIRLDHRPTREPHWLLQFPTTAYLHRRAFFTIRQHSSARSNLSNPSFASQLPLSQETPARIRTSDFC